MFPKKNSTISLSMPKISFLFLVYAMVLLMFLPATATAKTLGYNSQRTITEVKFNYSDKVRDYCDSVGFKQACLNTVKENRKNNGVFAYKYSNKNKYWYKRKR